MKPFIARVPNVPRVPKPNTTWDTWDTKDASTKTFSTHPKMSESHLDITRLDKVRHVGTKIIARCPACYAAGADKKGDHFFLNTITGKFGCTVNNGDAGRGHRREIFRLIGIVDERKSDPEQDRQWRQQRTEERCRTAATKRLIDTAKSKRAAIITRHPWDRYDVWENSPQRIDCPLVKSDPRHFLDSLFPADALLWTGETHESGQEGRHANRWRTCRGWHSTPEGERIGPMVTPAIWTPGTISRAAGNVIAAPYVVLDFDGFDGVKPETPEQLHSHVHASLSLIRWMREGLHWQLAAILWTGGKSVHAWFHCPASDVLDSLRTTAGPLGLDAGLIGRPEHPCRLPGHRHADTGNRSRVLWLQAPQA